MVQVPTLMPVTVVPLMLQTLGVAELKLTARPDDALAVTAPVADETFTPPLWFKLSVGAAPKLMVWLARLVPPLVSMLKLWVACGAAL